MRAGLHRRLALRLADAPSSKTVRERTIYRLFFSTNSKTTVPSYGSIFQTCLAGASAAEAVGIAFF